MGNYIAARPQKTSNLRANKDIREGERLGLKFFNRKKTLDHDFTSIVGEARMIFHRLLALQPATKPDLLFLLTLNVKIRCIWAMATFDYN